MDIDVPHHPIESRRDFFIHLFTITCGLLIALSMEGCVEWMHHRALVHEARTNIRQEIADNKKVTEGDIGFLKEDEARVQKNLEIERQLRDRPKNQQFQGHLIVSFSWSSPSAAAWRTAQDTGAFAYMPYAEVQRYADVYGQQEIVNSSVVQLVRQQTEASAPMFTESNISDLSKEEVGRLLHESAVTYVDLRTVGQIVQQLSDQYTQVLSAH